MNTVKPQRIAYLDTARGYLILLVVLGHVLIVLNPGYDRLLLTAAQEFISSFHMAAFFLIHGILLRNKENTSAPPTVDTRETQSPDSAAAIPVI